MTDPGPFVVRREETELHGDRWFAAGRADAVPTAVLLHAGICDRRSWLDVVPSLTDAMSVVAYDRNGFGDTPVVRGPRHMADLAAVLDATTSGPVWLVGNSAGGGLALDFTIAHPGRVAGLVLIGTAVTGAQEPELDAATQALAERLEAAEAAGDLEEVNRLEAWLWLDGPAAPEGRVGGAARELLLDMNRIALGNDAEAEDEATDGATAAEDRPPAWPELGRVTVPVLVLCGDLDIPFIFERSRALADALPHGRFQALHGRGHVPALEDPAELAQLIRVAVG